MTDRAEIRPARPDDVFDILDMIRELGEYERLAHEVVATAELLRRHLFEEPVAHAFLALVEGRTAGFALFFPSFSTFLGRPGVYLEDLYVRPAHRGKGLGRALLSHVAAFARERGGGRLEWSVLDWNEPAIGFYRRLGAVPLSDWTMFRLTGPALAALAEGAPEDGHAR
jgi:GNAT superfamily N-acetyltransferase